MFPPIRKDDSVGHMIKKTSFVNSGEQAHATKTRDVTMQPAVILRRHPVERAAY